MLLFKWFRYLLLVFAVFITILVTSFDSIRSFFSGSFPDKNTLLIRQVPENNSNKSRAILPNGTLHTHLNTLNISTNQSRPITDSTHELSLSEDYALSLERRTNCNLQKPSNCFVTNKSLIITFWSKKSSQRWLALNLLSVFPERYFDYMVMVHDNSSWNHHPAYDKVIWIHVKSQLRFWYIKRFVAPHTFRAYRYIWVVDDDARFHFNPRVYECVADKYNISLSSPAREGGAIMHSLTRVSSNYSSKVGRWTDFVEIGPIFIAKASAWNCLWKYLSEKVGLGYGLDNIWCGILSTCLRQSSVSKICAILDVFVVHHDSMQINSVGIGVAEMPAYHNYYKNYWAKMRVLGTVADNLTNLHLCASELSKD